MLGLVVSVESATGAVLLATHRTGKWPVNFRFFPTCALGWTLASYINTGIVRLSGTTGIVHLSCTTVFITWNSRLLVSVPFVQGQGRATGIFLATYSALVGKNQFRPGSAFPPAKNTTITSVLHFTVCVLCRLMTLNRR